MNNNVAVFDADGVFLRSMRPADYLEQRYGITREKMGPFFAANTLSLIDRADIKDILSPFLKEWGVPESVDEFLAETFFAGSEIDPDVAVIIADLRQRGVICCLATNQDMHRMAHLDERLKIREYFDQTFVSCEMGVKKPEHGFYHAIQVLFPDAALVFWDDQPSNVKAAQACGWTAFVFTKAAQMRSEVAQLSFLTTKDTKNTK